jgi:hypothetical protein
MKVSGSANVWVARLAVVLVSLCAEAAWAAPPAGYCDATVCNRQKRFSLSPWSHMKDRMGEVCMPALLNEAEAVEGKTLDSTSKWWKDNPTKRSVTYVKAVHRCTPEPKQ